MNIDKIREDKEIAERDIKEALIKFSQKHGDYLDDIEINTTWIHVEESKFWDLSIRLDASIKI